jgi:flavorubredoxin
MSTEVTEIAPDIFRIASFIPQRPVTFIQFLIRDEKPLLFHTGFKVLFPDTLEAIKRIIDPASLRYVSWSHLESDECGAINELLAVAPQLEPVQGRLGVQSGGDFIERPISALQDNEVLDLGTKKLRFLVTPHVPHCWDAIMTFEESTGTLFCSDLFAVSGQPPAFTERDIVGPAVARIKEAPDAYPIGPHTAVALARLEALQPKVIAGHHSSAYGGDAAQALRDLSNGMLHSVGLTS